MYHGIMIKNFYDLNAWLKGHELVLLIYKITNFFPKEERFSLVDQIRRASVSVTSNIAEGFSRQSKKEKIQFYFMALGSLTEIQSQLFVSKDLSFMDKREFQECFELTVVIQKLLNGLIKSCKK